MWRVAVAVAFVAAQVGLLAADFKDEDDPWVTILALGVPIVVGFVLDRWWAIALVLPCGLIYAIDGDNGELNWIAPLP